MIFARSLCLAGLLGLLAGCGGEAANDAAPAPRSTDALQADTGVPAVPGPDGRIPAFVTDSAPSGDTAAAAGSASAIRSVYTSLNEPECQLVRRDPDTEEPTYRCPGTAGYALLMHDWDARMTVDVVAPGNRTHRLQFSAVVTHNFSTLGPRAEWRVRNGTPVALIIRVNAAENPENPEQTTSYLAVAKVAPGQACVTDRIAPAADANEAARRAADQAPSRPCLADLNDRTA